MEKHYFVISLYICSQNMPQTSMNTVIVMHHNPSVRHDCMTVILDMTLYLSMSSQPVCVLPFVLVCGLLSVCLC